MTKNRQKRAYGFVSLSESSKQEKNVHINFNIICSLTISLTNLMRCLTLWKTLLNPSAPQRKKSQSHLFKANFKFFTHPIIFSFALFFKVNSVVLSMSCVGLSIRRVFFLFGSNFWTFFLNELNNRHFFGIFMKRKAKKAFIEFEISFLHLFDTHIGYRFNVRSYF